MEKESSAAAVLGRLGGKARWASRTTEERAAHAKMMVEARERQLR